MWRYLGLQCVQEDVRFAEFCGVWNQLLCLQIPPLLCIFLAVLCFQAIWWKCRDRYILFQQTTVFWIREKLSSAPFLYFHGYHLIPGLMSLASNLQNSYATSQAWCVVSSCSHHFGILFLFSRSLHIFHYTPPPPAHFFWQHLPLWSIMA